MIHLLHEGRVFIFEDVICQYPGHRHFYWKLKNNENYDIYRNASSIAVGYYFMEHLPVFSFQASSRDKIPCTKIERGRNKIAEFLK